jgi:hypothetical protein
MSIGTLQASTSASLLALSKDPPWGSKDLEKLKMLVDQGFSAVQIARQLGANVNDVQQMVGVIKQSASNTPAVSPDFSETTTQSTGQNISIKA